jgi:hypothetical protein
VRPARPSNNLLRLSLAAGALVVAGCSATVPRQPPGKPPSPKTVTREEPGGDAFDPQRAALERLASEPWGWRNDKRDVFHFPLTDWPNWRRVRYWGVPTFVGFRYGDKHRAAAALWVRRVQEGDSQTPEACMMRFEQWGLHYVSAYGARIRDATSSYVTWRKKDDVYVKSFDADVSALFSERTYLGTVGATLGWPGVCVVYGFAFETGEAAQAAEKARARYAREAFTNLAQMTPAPPEGIE